MFVGVGNKLKFPAKSLVWVKVTAPPTDDASTSIVKVLVGPVQFTPLLVNVGVTTIVANIGDGPAFVAVNAGIFPVPEAGIPIEAAELVQAYVVVPPVFVVPKVIEDVGLPLQTT